MSDQRPGNDGTFWNGVLAGVAVALVAFNAWLAVALSGMSKLLEDMGARCRCRC
jgi:hypothetical protein